LLDWLAARSPGHAAALADRGAIRVAIDQEFAGPDTPIAGAREIAIFPPVTGG
jgi:molybdopterin synthase sulfur carrier subunit